MIYGTGLFKGLYVTLLNFFRPAHTVQYPDRRVGLLGAAKNESSSVLKVLLTKPKVLLKVMIGQYVVAANDPQSSRFRGNEFTWFQERCTGCASCAKYCPMGTIEIVTSPGGIDVQEGESYAIDVFSIDTGRCMFCGLCVEACPYDALHMGTDFERSNYERAKLVIDRDQLISNPKRPSSWFRPQIEERELDPYDKDVDDHYQVGRHEKPEGDDMQEQWGRKS